LATFIQEDMLKLQKYSLENSNNQFAEDNKVLVHMFQREKPHQLG
jgi:hypothetical protein